MPATPPAAPQSPTPEEQKASRLLTEAKRLYGRSEFAAAAAKYAEAARLRPRDHTIFCNRGAALVMLRDYDGAIADCKAAVALHPKYTLALLRLTRAHLYLGEIEQARDAADDALAAALHAQRSANAAAMFDVGGPGSYGVGVGGFGSPGAGSARSGGPPTPAELAVLDKQVGEARRLAEATSAFLDALTDAQRLLEGKRFGLGAAHDELDDDDDDDDDSDDDDDDDEAKPHLSAFEIFSSEKRALLKEANPRLKVAESLKLITDMWKELSELERQVYTEKAAAARGGRKGRKPQPAAAAAAVQGALALHPDCKSSLAASLLLARSHLARGQATAAAAACKAVLPTVLSGASEVADARPVERLPDATWGLAAVLGLALWHAEDGAGAEAVFAALVRTAPAGWACPFPLPAACSSFTTVNPDGSGGITAPRKTRSPNEVLRTLRACESARRLALIAVREGRHADAARTLAAALRTALGAAPVLSALLTARAAAHAASANAGAALADLSDALHRCPANAKARLARGRLYAKAGRHGEAAADLAAALDAVRAGQPEATHGCRVATEGGAINGIIEAELAAARRAVAEAAERERARKRAAEEEAARRRRAEQERQQKEREQRERERQRQQYRYSGYYGGGGGGEDDDEEEEGEEDEDYYSRFFGGGAGGAGGRSYRHGGGAGAGAGAGYGRSAAAPPARAPSPPPHDYYVMLGVAAVGAGEKFDKEVKIAYRRLALRNHPDKGGDAEVMKLLNTAATVLADAVQRSTHDAELVAYRRRHPAWRYVPPAGTGAAAAAAAAGGAGGSDAAAGGAGAGAGRR